LGWAPDFPAEAAGNVLEVWYTGAGDPKNRDTGRKKRPPLPGDFLSFVPKWIAMIDCVWKERK
jgi:hypothetical protein